ncbi:MAG TPA: aromatic ring-hydroxylating dioxygenase subunit alpha [Casimicrobiaceae bacterium]|nr:aromatic ring-hydroxylating dioxygenase subunit alpha [Casimicrobiaceae bacterium]
MPASWYYDATHYARELEALWYRHWIAVCREDEISQPGDWRLVRIATQSIVVLRNDRSEIVAFHNTCRHRGSILCTADHGRFERARIVCPYHAWTYDLDGRLIATPRRMPTPDFDAGAYSLFDVAVERWGGFVFLNLGEDRAVPLTEALGDGVSRFANYAFERLKVGKRIVADVQANWKLVAENFAECFHCPPVHPELCRIVTAYRDAGAWGLRRDANGVAIAEATPEYRAGAQTLTLDGSARLPPFSGLSDAERGRLYTPAMLPPNLFLNVHPDYVNAHLMFPTGPESVRIVYDWLFEPQHLPLAEADLEHYVALWDITNRQDARNCEWQQQGIKCRRFEHGVFVPQEFDCERFVAWVRSAMDSSTIRR